MNPAVDEWVSKAEGDFVTAGRETRARKFPNYDAVCFHTQQCAEKYLKAFLQAEGIHIPKIHNLLIVMERYSVRVRYPGNSADKGDAQAANHAAKAVREFVRPKLGLK